MNGVSQEILELAQTVRLLAIGGKSCVGKGASGKIIARALSCGYHATGDDYRSKASEMKMSLEEFDAYVETRPQIDHQLDTIVHAKSLFGKWVFDGRLPALIIPHHFGERQVFRVLFTCSNPVRLNRAKKKLGCESIHEAGVATLKREAAYTRRYQNLYGISDVTDERYFDATVDTSVRTPEQVAWRVIELMAEFAQIGASTRTMALDWKPLERAPRVAEKVAEAV